MGKRGRKPLPRPVTRPCIYAGCPYHARGEVLSVVPIPVCSSHLPALLIKVEPEVHAVRRVYAKREVKWLK